MSGRIHSAHSASKQNFHSFGKRTDQPQSSKHLNNDNYQNRGIRSSTQIKWKHSENIRSKTNSWPYIHTHTHT